MSDERTREDPAVQEERILQAASETFAEIGFARATVGDIAAAAGVKRPLLYHYFAGKEELFEAVLLRVIGLFDPLIKPPDGPTDLETQLRALIDDYHELMREHPYIARMLIDVAALPSAPRAPAYERRVARLRVDMLDWVARVQDEIRPGLDVEQFLLISLSSLSFWYLPTPFGRALGAGPEAGEASLQRHKEAMCDLLLDGLRAPANTSPATASRRRRSRAAT